MAKNTTDTAATETTTPEKGLSGVKAAITNATDNATKTDALEKGISFCNGAIDRAKSKITELEAQRTEWRKEYVALVSQS